MNSHAEVALPVHPSTVMPEAVYAEPGVGQDVTLNPDFSLIRNDYSIRLVGMGEPLYAEASRLVTSMYGSRGLKILRPSQTDKRPRDNRREEVTLVAARDQEVLGTLTLGVDSPDGLLADSLYRPEINPIRLQGGRLCEVTRLALDAGLRGREVMASLFQVVFLLASEVYGRSDVLAEVHPRHARFYRRNMGYRVVGPERTCPRVGAPAVLMQLCLDFARNQIHQLAGSDIPRERSLYSLFLPVEEQQALLNELVVG